MLSSGQAGEGHKSASVPQASVDGTNPSTFLLSKAQRAYLKLKERMASDPEFAAKYRARQAAKARERRARNPEYYREQWRLGKSRRTPQDQREYKKRRRADPEFQARQKAYNAAYRQRADVKARRKAEKKAWRGSEAGKIWHRLEKRSRKLKERTGSNRATRAITRHCEELLGRQKWRCAVCRVDLKQGKHLDHVIPLAAGGKHEIGNLQWLCPPCNGAKAAKHPIQFMQERGFLL
jgi:5-methylcytosine-specific restriction endonuclease McrA